MAYTDPYGFMGMGSAELRHTWKAEGLEPTSGGIIQIPATIGELGDVFESQNIEKSRQIVYDAASSSAWHMTWGVPLDISLNMAKFFPSLMAFGRGFGNYDNPEMSKWDRGWGVFEDSMSTLYFAGELAKPISALIGEYKTLKKAATISDDLRYQKYWDDLAIELSKAPGTLSNRSARAWYLYQESKIPSLLDTSLSLPKQAKQAFDLRNSFRIKARELMKDRNLAKYLNNNDKNMTWSEVVKKYQEIGFSGDDLWKEIINASSRSRKSINIKLGM